MGRSGLGAKLSHVKTYIGLRLCFFFGFERESITGHICFFFARLNQMEEADSGS